MVPWLTTLVLLPVVGAVILLFVPKESVKQFAVVWSLIPLALAGVIWFVLFNPSTTTMQLQETYRWINSLNVQYHVGIDGLSMPLIFLTTLLTVIAVFYSSYTI
jgi:NADH:ubiquinone oxidoreductase subunit 4 (subunit M)